MRGTRTKALRREFRAANGRSPELIQRSGLAPINKPKWKRSVARLLAMLPEPVRKNYAFLADEPPKIRLAPVNEFRRFKREWKRSPRAGR